MFSPIYSSGGNFVRLSILFLAPGIHDLDQNPVTPRRASAEAAAANLETPPEALAPQGKGRGGESTGE